MNTYRINYSIGADETESTELTERSETAARKMFKAFCKTGTISSIELIRENVCATKQQERDTLAAIMQMVEELGPQSYLKTAFEGCFEDAESNIENDFADSMKARYENEHQNVVEMQQTIEELRQAVVEQHRAAETAQERAHEIEWKIPSADDLTDCIALVKDKISEHEQQMSEAAARIVELAGEPGNPEFQQAVQDHRAFKNSLDYYKALQKRLEGITAGA